VTPVTQACRLPVAAYTALVVPLADIEMLKADDPEGGPPLPRRFLRHADEQSVVAVRAVQQAIATLPDADRSTHGVLAAPCQAGRIVSSRTLTQYAEGGGVTVSTHVVPQASLHSVAATISVGLGMHGPSLGVAGGPDAVREGLLVADALRDTPGVDGWWVVFTELAAEPALDTTGQTGLAADGSEDAFVHAVALLVLPARAVPVHSSTQLTPGWWLDADPLLTSDGRRGLQRQPHAAVAIDLATRIRGCLTSADLREAA
jgi:hypothetical protein